MLIVPLPLVTLIPVPAERLATVYPEPLPMSN